MEGKAHCALLTVARFQTAVLRRCLIQLISLISSRSLKHQKVMKRLQAGLLLLHIKTHASAQHRAEDRYSKYTCDRWKKTSFDWERTAFFLVVQCSCTCNKKKFPESLGSVRKRMPTGARIHSCCTLLGYGPDLPPFPLSYQQQSRRQMAVPQLTAICPLK